MKQRPPHSITSRTSSITNSFAQAILPRTSIDKDQIAKVLAILEIEADALECAYCGATAVHWDHLNPFVRNKRPTGFLNEASNLVPACGPCNTSKGAQPWEVWMFGKARHSPASRGITDIEERAARIRKLEFEVSLVAHDFENFVSPQLWADYWKRLEEIEGLLKLAQLEAEKIRRQIMDGLAKS